MSDEQNIHDALESGYEKLIRDPDELLHIISEDMTPAEFCTVTGEDILKSIAAVQWPPEEEPHPQSTWPRLLKARTSKTPKVSSLQDFLDIFAILNIQFIPVIETDEATEKWWIAEGAGTEDIAFIFDAETEEFLRWSASTKD